MRYFTSDWHLGHKVIVPKYRTQFESKQEHDGVLFEKASKLKKRDILFVLGDFLFDCPDYEAYLTKISKLSCRIKLTLGNHDSLRLYKDARQLSNLELQLPLYSYKNNWISQAPIHPQELRGRDFNIHGHLHGDIVKKATYNWESDCNDLYIPDDRYFNVCLDNNNFNFVEFDEIMSKKDLT